MGAQPDPEVEQRRAWRAEYERRRRRRWLVATAVLAAVPFAVPQASRLGEGYGLAALVAVVVAGIVAILLIWRGPPARAVVQRPQPRAARPVSGVRAPTHHGLTGAARPDGCATTVPADVALKLTKALRIRAAARRSYGAFAA